jgi:hypothetical protein
VIRAVIGGPAMIATVVLGLLCILGAAQVASWLAWFAFGLLDRREMAREIAAEKERRGWR